MTGYHFSIIIALLLSVTYHANAERKIVYAADSTLCKYEIQKGMLGGEYRSYYKNGKLKCEGQFLQNNRFGFWTFYQSNGDIQCIRDYRSNNSFDEKGTDNKLLSVNLNSSENQALIDVRNINFKKRYFRNITQHDNATLFSKEKLIEQLTQLAIQNSKNVYTDSRFVTQAHVNALSSEPIAAIQLKEDVILDEASQSMQYRIIGIALLGYNSETKTYKELGWIYYPEIKTHLKKIKLSETANHYFCKTLLDIFEYRNFVSQIVRRDIPQHAAGDYAALEHDEALEIIDIENENTYIVNKNSRK